MSDDIPLRTPAYRVSRPRGMDPATRRLALIAAGLGGALLVLIGLWSLSGGGAGSAGVPVIAAPAGPVRVRPANPGGLHVAGADQSIFDHSTDGRDAAQGSLIPGPERPDLWALRTSAGTARGGSAGTGAGPAGGAIADTAASGLPQPPAFRSAPTATAAAGGGRTLAALPAAAPGSAAPAATRPGAGGGTTVQLAALPSRAAARAEWQHLRRRLPALLGSHRLVLAEATVGGRVWWRVRTAGFASAHQARRFCAQMHAAGAACDVTPF